ncbi:MAG: intein-containing DNA gyrase subunit B [Candidatus Nealsonbacteria bacterium]|nr:intein-containing DNA gyrase subunit B [Candidatus Nealsonbacteria bacterium]
MDKENKKEYTSKDIFVLEGLDPVRKRPGMYVGSTGPDGLHHLIKECLDNSLDEAIAGYAKNIEISLLPNNRVSVTDDGRGIPVDVHAQTKKSALETVMTTLHAGGKFGGDAYKISGGLHGVGISVVCALSNFLRAEVSRDGFKYSQEYVKGKVKTKLVNEGKTNKRGTTIIFEPDVEIFKDITFNAKKIISNLRQQAYLTKGTRITFNDLRDSKNEKKYLFYFEGGILSYIKHLTRGIQKQHPNIFYCFGNKDEVITEVSFVYTEEFESYEESFTNNIITKEGGSHLTGFRSALTRTLNDYARKNGILKSGDDNLSGEDVREGLTAVVSVKIREPQFEGQTKGKLGNPEVKPAVEVVVSEALTDFFERNPQDARSIVEKCLISSKARKAARAARETVLRKGILEGLSLPGKLSDCSSRKPEESELYIVEGDSAGGCFSGDTEVALVDGRSLSFKNLIKEEKQGKRNYCYTIKDDGTVGIELITHPRRTKKNVEVIKVILDNGEEITCTPDHKFMMRDGSYKEARNIDTQDSLMPLNRKFSEIGNGITIKGYEMIFDNKNGKWIFIHLLSDKYNLEKGKYLKKDGSDRHHIDFDKLNNNPENIRRMTKEDHLCHHREMLKYGLHREDVKDKCRKKRQTKEYREKISAIMSTPEMREMLSKRAKKQWENEEYKNFMVSKFLEFYEANEKYRERNRKALYNNQKEYWGDSENRKKQAKKIKEYFENNPEKKEKLVMEAKKQWKDEELLKWRAQETKKQWTPEFRKRRKASYDNTYREKALKLMKEIVENNGEIDKGKYNQKRIELRDKSILRYDTICERFFENKEEKLKEAVANYNHKVKRVERLQEKIDVYDIEVKKTHNFALSSGVFVHNSCKGARDRKFQAILPLKGKILNVERARLDKILASKEIKSLIIALGTAVAEDFNINKLRYHRIIIMSDADSDGNHIKTLLLTLFYRYFRPLIDLGYLYVAQPPLYKIQAGKRVEYAYTDDDKRRVLDSMKKDKDEDKVAGLNIQRYKGLGEMNPSQLWETTMNPDNRILIRVEIEDVKEADRMFDVLMGEEVLPRKKFIQAHAKKVSNLDI